MKMRSDAQVSMDGVPCPAAPLSRVVIDPDRKLCVPAFRQVCLYQVTGPIKGDEIQIGKMSSGADENGHFLSRETIDVEQLI
jgi:hypothetical protein